MNKMKTKLKSRITKTASWLEKGAVALHLKKPKVDSGAKLLKLGLMVLLSALFTFILVRALSLYRLRTQLVAQTPLLSVYDPVRLKNQLKNQKTELLLIDLRPKKDFKKGRIKTAVNVTWNNDLSAWLKHFKQLQTRGKTIILYEYSQASVLPQELTLYLKKTGYRAYYLAIGYNEWRHFYTFWLPEPEWSAWQPEEFSDLPE